MNNKLKAILLITFNFISLLSLGVALAFIFGMIKKWFLSLFTKKLNRNTPIGTYLIFVNDLNDEDLHLCTTTLKYNQVVKLLEAKDWDSVKIVDVGLRFKDSSSCTFMIGIHGKGYVPGKGICWLRMDRFRIATDEEFDRWMSENDIQYNRDKKLNQILH